jgi:pheromone shutdown protein TraB
MRAPRVRAAAAAPPPPPPRVAGPPPGYDHRAALGAPSLALVRARHPELLDLAISGALLAVPRPAEYSERREDGYLEPEVVYLVGTAHLSARSAADVARVVEAVHPESVVVELCKGRAAQMYGGDGGDGDGGDGERASGNAGSSRSNPFGGMAGGSLLGAVGRSASLGGAPALALRLALASLSARFAARAGAGAPGEEFRAARRAAERVGAQLVLGDRPIEVTLRRAWDALSWRERGALAAELARGAGAAGAGGGGGGDAAALAAAVDALTEDDSALAAMLAALSERYPAAASPLVHERDLYLAWSLRRSKAVNGARAVVGVVGRGHLRGVCHALAERDGPPLSFRDLAGVRGGGGGGKEEQRWGAARRLAVEVAAAGGCWWLWELWSTRAG